jgi:hypothetical protein
MRSGHVIMEMSGSHFAKADCQNQRDWRAVGNSDPVEDAGAYLPSKRRYPCWVIQRARARWAS